MNKRILCIEFEGEFEPYSLERPRASSKKFKETLRAHGYRLVERGSSKVNKEEGEFALIVLFGLSRTPNQLRGLAYLLYLRHLFPKPRLLCVTGHEEAKVIEEIEKIGGDYFLRERSELDFIRRVSASTNQ